MYGYFLLPMLQSPTKFQEYSDGQTLGQKVFWWPVKKVGFQSEKKDVKPFCCPDINGEHMPPFWRQDRKHARCS